MAAQRGAGDGGVAREAYEVWQLARMAQERRENAAYGDRAVGVEGSEGGGGQRFRGGIEDRANGGEGQGVFGRDRGDGGAFRSMASAPVSSWSWCF